MTLDLNETGLGSALDQLADLRDRLDKALVDAESHQAARGRAVNAAQLAVTCMERHRDVLQRAGLLDDAARVQYDIKCVQEACR